MAANPIPQAPWGEYVPYIGPMNIEQFEQLPVEEGWIYELHQGRLLVMPGPGSEHGLIEMRLGRILGNYLDAHGLGEVYGTSCYILSLPGAADELLCPDLSYIVPARQGTLGIRSSYAVGAPDLAIEIASPNDHHPQLAAKTAIYLRAGVQLVWNIWPKTQSVEVWEPTSLAKPTAILTGSELLKGGLIIPGFQRPVRDIFNVNTSPQP